MKNNQLKRDYDNQILLCFLTNNRIQENKNKLLSMNKDLKNLQSGIRSFKNLNEKLETKLREDLIKAENYKKELES